MMCLPAEITTIGKPNTCTTDILTCLHSLTKIARASCQMEKWKIEFGMCLWPKQVLTEFCQGQRDHTPALRYAKRILDPCSAID